MIEYYASSARVNSYQDPWLVGEGLITSGSVSVPSLDLNFITDGVSPLVTFSRGSNATQFDSTGSLVYAPANLLLRSQAFATSPWVSGGLTSITNNTTDVTDPAGTNTATKLVVAGSAGLVGQNVVLSSINQTGSVWLRCASGTVTGSLILFLSIAPGTVIGFQSITITTTWQRFTFNTSQLPINGNTYTFNVQNLSGGTVYAWGAQLNPTPMVGGVTASLSTYYPTVASAYYGPRLDYDPTTLASQGLLIEEQRTNSIRNNTMQGAVAGTPGTAPTNWSVTGTANGLTRTISTGTENGIAYIDVRYAGTTTAASFCLVRPEAFNQVVAASGQSWTSSLYMRVVAGSTVNITGFENWIIGADAGGATTESNQVTPAITGTMTRFTVSRTMNNASTAFVYPYVAFTFNSGVAIDITLRIGLPQLEQGAFATSVIPTTTAAATRSADVASVNTLTPWYNAVEGTLFVSSVQFVTGSAGQLVAAELGDGTLNNIMQVGTQFGLTNFQTIVNTGGVAQATFIQVASTSLTSRAFAYKVNDFAQSVNGAAASVDTAGTVPTVTSLGVGMRTNNASQLNGYIRRITYYPRRLANAELQAITS